MVRLDVDTRRVAGHTLVEGRLHNDATETVRVTLATPLSPVYPPRSRGRPVEGWHPAAGHTRLCLAAGQRAGVGFATPARPDGQVLTVVETERAPAPDGGLTATPRGVVGALGDPLPPPEVTTGPPVAAGSSPDRPAERATPGNAARGSAATDGDAAPGDDCGGERPDHRRVERDNGETARPLEDLRRLRRAAVDLARAAADAERRLGGERR